MLILSFNCGSSSIKSALIDTDRNGRRFDLRVEEIGKPSCRLQSPSGTRALDPNTTFEHAASILLGEVQSGAAKLGAIEAVAHRIVHGGELFVRPTRLDDASLRELDAASELAPLHNRPALESVRAAMQALPSVPHVGVFDTAFHSTLPKRARQYALPSDISEKLGIRRYGFHGMSHSHVLAAIAAYSKASPQQLRIVSCHLGNGASVAAIEYGRSVETSMGMTPLEGLVMGTRAGDLDPGVLLELMRVGKMSLDELDSLLNKRSGLSGLTGTNDMREIERRAAEGDESCRSAIALYSHRLRKYIGAYAAVMGGVDVIAFTGGIGEHSALVRHGSTQRLEFLGAVLDEVRNRDAKLDASQPIVEISERGSRTRIMAVKTDEELAIACETARVIGGRRTADGA